MNDGQYTNLRNYLEEIASNQKQILTELKRINALPQAAPFAGTLETEPPPLADDAHMRAVTQKVDLTPKSKSSLQDRPVEVMPKATKPDFTVTVEDEPKPKAATKKGK